MKAKEVLAVLKISRVTLTSYIQSGKIRGTKLPNGYYNYNEDDVYKLLGVEKQRKNVIYARVSTSKQKQDLENQIETITRYMNINGVGVDAIYQDIKSGLHLDRSGFNSLLDEVQNNEIDTVYISYKDRLARLSYELVIRLFSKSNTKVVIINDVIKTDEQELFEDLMQIIHSFSMKMYSKRRLAKKILENTKSI
jgi:predicted site-specific integrase-resolvase